MRTTLALLLLAVLAGQQAAAVQYGTRSSRKLLQENRIGDGAGAIADAAGADTVGADVANVSDADDGDLTNDLANAGTDVGNAMLDTLPAAGSEVPGRRRLLQPAGGTGGSLPIAADLTGDAGQTVQEVSQLASDTTSNLGAGGGTALPTGRRLHQNAGTGAGLDAIFSDFDTSTGEGIENAEDNIAGDISGKSVSGSGGSGGSSGGPGGPPGGPGGPGRKLLQPANGGGAGGLPVVADLTGDAGQTVQEASQLASDTTSNLGAGSGTALPTGRRLHQNAGTGAGLDAIFSDFDTATGEGVENAEDNIAGDVSSKSVSGGGGSGGPPSGPQGPGGPGGPGKRLLQENRIGDGAGAIADAAGADAVGADVANVSDADDGDLTNDLANAGTDVGNAMLDTLPAAGSTVPGK